MSSLLVEPIAPAAVPAPAPGVLARIDAPVVEAARPADAAPIAELLGDAAPETIALGESEVRARIGRFTVVRDAGAIVAVTALHPLATDGVEVRSVAVDPSCRGRGFGRTVVRAALASEAARDKHAFCFTFRPGFFESLGFERVDPRTVDVPSRPDRPDRLGGRARRAMHRRPAPRGASA